MSGITRIAPKSSARGLKAFVLVVCLIMLGGEGWRDWSEREQEIASVSTDTLNLAKSLAQHAQDSFEVADALLVDVVDRVQTSGAVPDAIDRLGSFLVERVQSLQRIKSLTVYGADGLLLTSSLPGHRGRVNVSDEPFFQHHNAVTGSGWFLGPLIRDPLGSDWVLTLSRRFNKLDGSFGGVVQASIPPRYFANFFGRIDVGTQGSISLFHTDGTLLSRYPYVERAIGTNGAYEPWFRDGKASGVYEYKSPVDGVKRIGGFQRNHIFPIGVLASIGRDEALSNWNHTLIVRLILTGLLVGTIAILGWSLIGQLRRREEAEAELAILATTDGLTGLANRRTFDRQLETEWLRAARDGKSVALLLVDVDRFKSYNDIYGHQAGDECLQTVAKVIAGSARRPSDLVARYGGEEFIVLLPDLSAAGAAAVAEDIRARIEALHLPHEGNTPIGILTVSIGSASRSASVDRSRISPRDLISLADAALYRAKQSGRNRIATAKADLSEARLQG
ncbi:sensor domain-containing diguanylate cyclase [Microvirga arsenatis]|uniref:diguanylate cyclase n=1 Tax=Microvirga arsenatis TaxID=2692265 RepID=A0ABW9YW01_9HYPH|nr:sensor domain-containing diguanylate cyclase [Microvirga arsenatis]NBJ09476.1 diguanylate cyclase [Microvirga arsenatis]NBJ23665.1 diguanylate cyclase [Microvirga arsenatis]